MKSVRNLIGIVLALALAVFAGPSLAKTFYAQLVDANGNPTDVVPNGNPNPVTLRLKVYNTSTEPATINSLVLCTPEIPGVTLLSASPYTLVAYTYDPIKGGINCTGWTVTNFPGIRRQRDLTFTLTANVNAACTFTGGMWKIGANTGNAYPGGSEFDNVLQTSAYFGCSGPLACPSITSLGYVSQVTESGIEIKRGENKNLSACVATPYQVIDNRSATLDEQKIEFIWNSSSQPTAAYKYLIPWEAQGVSAPDVIWNKQVYVQWPGLSSNIVAPSCLDDRLPFQVATLYTDVGAAATANADGTITVTPVGTTPDLPFAISVGPDTAVERMLVTATAAGTVPGTQIWTVIRRNGNTPKRLESPVTPTGHTAGAKIAFNPLPLYFNGTVWNQAQMCVTKQNHFVVGSEPCTAGSTPSACSVFGAETEILDYGDGITIYK